MSRTASILIVALVAAGSTNRLAGQEPQKSTEKQANEKKAAVDAAAAGLASAQAKRNEAEAILDQYKATVDRWQIKVGRIQTEVEKGIVDRCVLQEIERQLRSSLAESKAAEAVLAIAEKEVAAEKARLDQAGAELGQAIEKQINDRKAAVDAASARLAKVQAKRDAAAEEIDQYEATVKRWQIQVERLRREMEAGVVEPAVLTEHGRQLRASQGEFKKAQTALAILEKEVAVEKARLNLARAELDLVQTKLQPAEQGQPKNEDAVKKLLKTQLEAAKKAYRASADGLLQWNFAQKKGLVPPSVTHGDVHVWSVRWLDAQRDLSQSKDERTAAFADHYKRMEKLQRAIAANKDIFEGGEQAAAQWWYVAEAELWLLKEQGKNGK